MAPGQWGTTSETRAPAGLVERDVMKGSELLQKQKQALIDVFLIRKFHCDDVQDLLHGHSSVALSPY